MRYLQGIILQPSWYRAMTTFNRYFLLKKKTKTRKGKAASVLEPSPSGRCSI